MTSRKLLKTENSNVISQVLYIFCMTFLGFLNIKYCYSETVQNILIALQLVVLAILFIRNKPLQYLIMLVSFVSVSLEYDYLFPNTQWFGLLKLEFLGIRFVIFLIIPIFIMLFFKRDRIKEECRIFDITNKTVKLLIFCFVSAIVIGLINIITNDNQIRLLAGYARGYVSLVYFFGFSVILIIGSYFVVLFDNKLFTLKQYIVNLLISISLITILSFLFCERSIYDVYEYLLAPAASFFIPVLILLPVYETNCKNILIMILGLIAGTVGIVFGSSGKSLVLILLIPVILLIKAVAKVQIKHKKFISLIVVVFLCISICLLASYRNVLFSNPDNIFEDKINQLLSMIAIWEPDYLINMPLSPRARIIELINIICEYIEKPYQILFGKGFLGSFTDHTNILTYFSWAFTNNQWEAGIFYQPHESLSVLFLMNGLIGLYLIYYLVKLGFKTLLRSLWTIVGVVWFMFFYGYSISLTFLGVGLFVVGLIEADRNNSREYKAAVVDYLFLSGHKKLYEDFVSDLNSMTSTFVIANGDYYSNNQSTENQKVCHIKSMSIPGSNVLDSRIRLFKNIYSNFKAIRNYRFDVLFVAGYEGTTFAITYLFLKKYAKKIYIFEHHQIDEISQSRIKSKIYGLYKNKVNHIVIEDFIKDFLIDTYEIHENLVEVYPNTLIPNTDKENSTNNKLAVGISNSNDEQLIEEIIQYENKTHKLENAGYKLVLKTKKKYPDCSSNIVIINHFISDEEYRKYYSEAKYILVLFPNTFKYRASGTIVDAFSYKKLVLSTNILIGRFTETLCPDMCKVFNSVDELFEDLINDVCEYNENEYQNYINRHSVEYRRSCLRKMLSI